MLLNWVQLALMVIVGHWLVPMLGGDALHLGISPWWFLVMIVATSVAAVGLALLIAAYTRRFDHAAALGGGLNVVLGAIAGVMVPRMLMPPTLQTISEWSPMGWALDGLQSVFLGEPGRCVHIAARRVAVSFRHGVPARQLSIDPADRGCRLKGTTVQPAKCKAAVIKRDRVDYASTSSSR